MLKAASERGLSFSDNYSVTPQRLLISYTTSLIITLIHNDGTSLKKSIIKLASVVCGSGSIPTPGGLKGLHAYPYNVTWCQKWTTNKVSVTKNVEKAMFEKLPVYLWTRAGISRTGKWTRCGAPWAPRRWALYI